MLPDKRRGRAVGSVTRVPHTAAGEPGPPLVGSVRDVEPLEFEQVREPAQRLLFRELLGRYHYLGHTVPFGAQLRYLVYASRPARAVVGCLQFSSPAWRMAARDRWIGWDDGTRARNLQHVVNNSRFLLLPWVAVKNLASAVLARGIEQLVVDWPRHYHLKPLVGGDAGGPAPPPRRLLPRGQLGGVGRDQRSRAHGPARSPRRCGAQNGSRLSCDPGCEAAASGGLSHASCSPPHRCTRPGAVCGVRRRIRRCQSLPFFARGPADERERPRTGVERRGQELLRKLLQGHLDQRSPGEAAGPVEGADGVERSERRRHDRQLETTFGTVSVERLGYAHPGHESLHPLDASLNLPAERYSLEVRRRVAEAAASRSFDEALFELSRHCGAQVPKRQAEQLVARAAEDFDAFYEDRRAAAGEPVSDESVVVLTFDGKGVVLHHEDLCEATRKAAERRRQQREQLSVFNRLRPGEKKHSKRMATVAAVYAVAPFVRSPEDFLQSLMPRQPADNTKKSRKAKTPAVRPRPVAKRVWASLEHEPAEVVTEAMLEAERDDP